MGDKAIFGQINKILEEEGKDIRINDMKQLRDFLADNESSNSEIYENIRELYDQLVMGIGMW